MERTVTVIPAHLLGSSRKRIVDLFESQQWRQAFGRRGPPQNVSGREQPCIAAGTFVSACDLSPSFVKGQASSFNGVEQRLAAAIEAYDAQGNHRTATTADNASAEWLTQQI
jgi:hypothetical protein